jgi:hypothetical protein
MVKVADTSIVSAGWYSDVVRVGGTKVWYKVVEPVLITAYSSEINED